MGQGRPIDANADEQEIQQNLGRVGGGDQRAAGDAPVLQAHHHLYGQQDHQPGNHFDHVRPSQIPLKVEARQVADHRILPHPVELRCAGKPAASVLGDGRVLQVIDIGNIGVAQVAQALCILDRNGGLQIDDGEGVGIDRMRDQHITEQPHPAYAERHPTLPVPILQNIGLQLKHEQQQKPGGLVQAGGELAGPVQKAGAFMQGVGGPGPVLKNIEPKIDDKQPINHPLDGLLHPVRVETRIGGNC